MAQWAMSNSPSGTLYYPLLALTVVLNPLQGFFNALIYLRPRYLRSRHKQRDQKEQEQPSRQPTGKETNNPSSWLLFGLFRNDHPSSNSFDGATPLQAILSAISICRADDEDDWEENLQPQNLSD